MRLLKIAGGLFLAIVLIVFSLARIAFEIIGASTAPDDFALLRQRMPRVLEWLFTTPWIVPTLIVVGATALATWLLWSGIKGAAFEPMGDAAPPVTMADVEEAIGRQLGQPATGVSEHSNELEEISASIAELRGKINTTYEAAKAVATNVGDVLGLRIQALNERVDGIATGCAELESTVKKFPEKIDILMERNRERIEGQMDGVNQAFRAILNREWHYRLFSELDGGFELLMEPFHSGKPIENWKQWQEHAKGWRGKLDQWLIIADYYAMGTAENVNRLPDNLHDDEVVWSIDEAVLTANQIARFKEIATIWRSAGEAKSRVDRLLEQAAFNLPTSHRRLDAPPRMGE
jgi:hypothetical protein